MCTVYFVHTNDKLLFAIYVFVENVLACDVVEIIVVHISKVVLKCGIDESREIIFGTKLESDILY